MYKYFTFKLNFLLKVYKSYILLLYARAYYRFSRDFPSTFLLAEIMFYCDLYQLIRNVFKYKEIYSKSTVAFSSSLN